MKKRTLILLAILALCGVGRSESTNSFDLFLLAEPVDQRLTTRGQGDWSRLRRAASPVISAADIVSYNFTDHGIKLRPGVLAKIPRPAVAGTPFVVVADGQRVYLGVFTTCISSLSFAVPSITVDRRMLAPGQPPDTLFIERAYPQPACGVGPDPRGDQRIKTALAALHKLKSRE
jgi:hypothetical protein